MSDTVKLNILRYDPSTDEAPYYQEYEAEWQDDGETDFMSLLQSLCIAYESCEDPATHDMNCAAGWCGRCTVMVDGVPRLACWTKAEKGKTYTVEPLRGFPVIKDLVVDKSAVYQKYVDANVAIQSAKPITKLDAFEPGLYWDTLQKFNVCRECMCCYAACPKTNGGLTDLFVGPGAMMQIAMRHLDPRDEADRAWQAAFSGVFECDLCGECSSVCPATIDLVGMMSMLQKAASEKGLDGGASIIPSSTRAMAETIAATQNTSEASTASGLSQASPEEIINSSCGADGCHTAESILNFRTDAESAQLRVDSHVASKVNLTDEQSAAFAEFFTE